MTSPAHRYLALHGWAAHASAAESLRNQLAVPGRAQTLMFGGTKHLSPREPMPVTAPRRRKSPIRVRETARGWYIMVGNFAVCAFNGPPHLHRQADRAHPDHLPKVPLGRSLSYDEALRATGDLCERLDREPTFAELREALA